MRTLIDEYENFDNTSNLIIVSKAMESIGVSNSSIIYNTKLSNFIIRDGNNPNMFDIGLYNEYISDRKDASEFMYRIYEFILYLNDIKISSAEISRKANMCVESIYMLRLTLRDCANILFAFKSKVKKFDKIYYKE